MTIALHFSKNLILNFLKFFLPFKKSKCLFPKSYVILEFSATHDLFTNYVENTARTVV